MVSLKLDFSKKDFVWIGLFIVILVAGIGVALNSGNPGVMGHTADEIDGLPAGTDLTSIESRLDLLEATGGSSGDRCALLNTETDGMLVADTANRDGYWEIDLTLGGTVNNVCEEPVGCDILIIKNDGGDITDRGSSFYFQLESGNYRKCFATCSRDTNGDNTQNGLIGVGQGELHTYWTNYPMGIPDSKDSFIFRETETSDDIYYYVSACSRN